jgi:hypothetical protein
MEIRFTQMNLIQVVEHGSTWLIAGGFHGWENSILRFPWRLGALAVHILLGLKFI